MATLGTEKIARVKREETKPFSRVQQAVAKLYGGGDLAYVDNLEKAAVCGDGLFDFLVIEAGDAENLDEYLGMIAAARNQLTDLLDNMHLFKAEEILNSLVQAKEIAGDKAAVAAEESVIGKKTYEGSIMGITDSKLHVVQNTGREAVIHDVSSLDLLPQDKAMVNITYQNGRGEVHLLEMGVGKYFGR